MKETIQVALSMFPANSCWKKNTLLSFNKQGMVTIHLMKNDILTLIQCAGRKIDRQGINNVTLIGEQWDISSCWAFWQGYRTPKKKQYITWPMLSDTDQKELNNRISVINWVRDNINSSAEDLGPEKLVQNTVNMISNIAKNYIKYSIIKGDELLNKKYMGLYTVGRGSKRPPTLLILDYNPYRDLKEPILACLVGKGITFDSGGYSLKDSNSMDTMKSDMGGAAILVGALALAINRGLTKRVRLILCCTDNMVNGNAFKPGDIISYRNGKSVEVMNTDAEGRLVLADGLIEASISNPQLIIDCATLTGAAKIALSHDYHALFSFDDELVLDLMKSAKEENERFWRLPLEEFHRNYLSSSFADMSNISSKIHSAGASTAAAFLSNFVKNYRHGWVHIDCSAVYLKNEVDLWSIGATGLGVLTLANLLLTRK